MLPTLIHMAFALMAQRSVKEVFSHDRLKDSDVLSVLLPQDDMLRAPEFKADYEINKTTKTHARPRGGFPSILYPVLVRLEGS